MRCSLGTVNQSTNFIEQIDQSAIYIDMHEIHVVNSKFDIHVYIKYKTHNTVYMQHNQLNNKLQYGSSTSGARDLWNLLTCKI